MKTIYLIIAIFIGITTVQAQDSRYDKIKALKTAHITQELDLSSEEAQEFWPIYNVYEQKMWSIRKRERREIMEKIKKVGLDNMTNAEANGLIDIAIELEELQLSERKQLIRQLQTILPPKKIIKLKKAEEDFKKQLLERYRQKRSQDKRP
ncbi:MAG: sensor of ECF-type sigma factor [Flavobacteriaceae bacterium]|nr:sensor of ECF-type sigma factor [Flavobacteriaceae bacterium]